MPIEIVPPGTHIDFLGRWKPAVVASLVVIAIGLVLAPSGLRWGIDFAGGTEVAIHFAEGVSTGEGRIREVAGASGIADPEVVRFGDVDDHEEFLIRFSEVRSESGDVTEAVDRLTGALREQVGELTVDSVGFVGPKVGAELRRDGAAALAIASLLMLLYIAFRFTPRFAPGAVVAIVHDVLVTSSIWIVLGQQFDLQVLAALLAIVGYSLNDTIIVYDRIRENMERHTTYDLPEVINRSVNQTLSRTILTSGTTLMAVIALLVLGGPVIRPFALAMAIGIVVGTYSSVYIAAPILVVLERRFGAPAGAARQPGKSKAKAARARG